MGLNPAEAEEGRSKKATFDLQRTRHGADKIKTAHGVGFFLKVQQKAGAGCLVSMVESILVTGGTGLIGRSIVDSLVRQNQPVKVLTRHPKPSTNPQLEYVQWNPSAMEIAPDAMTNVRGILHLAGAPVAQRWTERSKQSILDSRIQTTALLARAIAALPNEERPEVCVSASAIGLYPSGPDLHHEESPGDEGFLADVVRAWETGVAGLETLGLRTVSLRIGLVLFPHGGMLGKLLPVFKMGLGSAVGSGEQWQSWVHIIDVQRAFEWALNQPDSAGAFNVVAPQPVTNSALSAAIAKACNRPFWAPRVPPFALKLVYGDMASVVLASQRVTSERIEKHGFAFQFSDLDEALSDLI